MLTTHYIEEAEQLADRIGILHKGKLLLVESRESLMERHGGRSLEEIYLELTRKADGRARRVSTIALKTLFLKEVRRFSKVWLQTVLSPLVTTSLYFLGLRRRTRFAPPRDLRRSLHPVRRPWPRDDDDDSGLLPEYVVEPVSIEDQRNDHGHPRRPDRSDRDAAWPT